MRIVKTLLFTLFFHCCYLANTQTLVQDINDASIGSRPQFLTESSDHLYFIANSPEYGTELFRTNEERTELVKDFYKGSTAFKSLYNFDNHLLAFLSKPERNTIELWKIDHDDQQSVLLKTFGFAHGGIVVEDEFYFVASDRNGEEQLWKTDGTVSGTTRIKSFPKNSGLYVAIEYNEEIYFIVNDDTYGRELWKTDGTEDGTAILKDINPDGDGGIGRPVEFKGRLFFRANDGIHGSELWSTDGTSEGTQLVKDLYLGTGWSSPLDLYATDDKIYFRANSINFGHTIWVSDGTSEGTYLLRESSSAQAVSGAGFIEMNDVIYFNGDNLSYGYELWRTDGTKEGTYIVKDIDPGSGNAVFHFRDENKVIIDELLYFRVQKRNDQFPSLWRTDGTEEGTFELAINSSVSAHFFDVKGVKNSIYFSGEDAANGTELWSYHTLTQVATLQSNLNNEHTSSSDLYFLIEANNKLLFSATTKEYGRELWALDLSTNKAEIVKDIRIGEKGSHFLNYAISGTTLNDEYILFIAYDNSGFPTLWKSDGTAGNTVPIIRLDARPDGHHYTSLTKLNNEIFFNTNRKEHYSSELWKTDGTVEGTQLVKTIHPSGNARIQNETIVFDGKIFFNADDGVHGRELWRSDGTMEGTIMIKDVNKEGYFDPRNFMILGDELLFTAETPAFGDELWKYNKNTDQIELVKDIKPGRKSSNVRALFELNGAIYLSADDGTHGRELWRSDGTAEGTILFKDINRGKNDGVRNYYGFANDEVGFFRADAPKYGNELWVTDGTEAGTSLVMDIAPGNLWSDPHSFTPYDARRIIFSANSGATATSQAFITDGTEENTFAILDKAPFIGRPTSFTITGEKMYFISGNEVIGRELFQMPIEICERAEMKFNEPTEGGIYKALDRVTLSMKTTDNSSVVVKAGYEVVLEEGFETADDGWLTINIEECIEEENIEEKVVEEREEEINDIDDLNLSAAPNPFTKLTNIQYQIPERSEANLLLFTAQGQLARSILSVQTLEAGQYSTTLDGSDLEAGLYFLILQTATEKVVRKLVVVK